jgi:hypothetical protein
MKKQPLLPLTSCADIRLLLFPHSSPSIGCWSHLISPPQSHRHHISPAHLVPATETPTPPSPSPSVVCLLHSPQTSRVCRLSIEPACPPVWHTQHLDPTWRGGWRPSHRSQSICAKHSCVVASSVLMRRPSQADS